MLYIIKFFFEMLFMTKIMSPCFYTRYDTPKSVPLGVESYGNIDSDKYPEALENLGGNDNDGNADPSKEPKNRECDADFVQGNDNGAYDNAGTYINPEVFEDNEAFVQGRANRSDANGNSCEEFENCEDDYDFVQVDEDVSSDDDSSDDDSSDDDSFDGGSYDIINPCGDPEVFEDYDSFIQVAASNPYSSNYYSHALKNSRYSLPLNAKVSNEPNLSQEDEEPEDFDLVESFEEVVKKQEDEESNELTRNNSSLFPMESSIVRNLRCSQGILRELIRL